MLRISLVLAGLLALTLSSGCLMHARGGVGVSASATYDSPDLVYVSPGVYVVADYHEPVFYSNGFYWLYTDGYWYRSNYYSGGWVHVSSVPGHIRTIRRPRSYVRYRARGQVYHRDRSGRVIVRDNRSRRAPARHHRDRGPAVRDNRSHRSRSAPAVRDNRSHRARPAPKQRPVRDNRGKSDKRDKRDRRDRD